MAKTSKSKIDAVLKLKKAEKSKALKKLAKKVTSSNTGTAEANDDLKNQLNTIVYR